MFGYGSYGTEGDKLKIHTGDGNGTNRNNREIWESVARLELIWKVGQLLRNKQTQNFLEMEKS